MRRTIILLKTFFVFLLLLQGCNNNEHQTGEDHGTDDTLSVRHRAIEKEKKKFIFSPELNDKYDFEKMALGKIDWGSGYGMQSYKGSFVVGKRWNEKYNSFINSDTYRISQSVLFNDVLYIEISDGNGWGPKTIHLKIEKDKYETVVTIGSDCAPSIICTPLESTLKMSSNEFHVGDTIVGEISLLCRGYVEDNIVAFQFDGHFMGVINQGTEEWEKIALYTPSGKYVFPSCR